jgi:hypothetical protein
MDDNVVETASRREFVKCAAYVAPAILTLAVAPEYAKAGSVKGRGKDKESRPKEPKPIKEPKGRERAW